MLKEHFKNCRFINKEEKIFQDFTFDIYSRIESVPLSAWESVCEPGHIFLKAAYLSATENASLPAMQYRYIILKEKKEVIAAYYFQVVNVASREFGSVLNLEKYGWIAAKLNPGLNRFVFSAGGDKPNYVLCCGNLIVSGEYGVSFINKTKAPFIYKALPEIMQSISENLKKSGNVCAWMAKDFYDISSIDHVLTQQGFSRLPMDPEMIFAVNPQWKSFTDYINALSAKYRLRVNNSMKKATSLKLRELSIAEMEKFKKQIDDLYTNVWEKASVRLVRVNANYFIRLKKDIKENFYIKTFFDKDVPVAFYTGLIHNGNHEAHVIGMNYRYNKSHLLYQNILYNLVKDAIERRSGQLFFGRTAMEIKSTVGASPFNLHMYVKLTNSFFNGVIKPVIRHSSPDVWVPRQPYRNGI